MSEQIQSEVSVVSGAVKKSGCGACETCSCKVSAAAPVVQVQSAQEKSFWQRVRTWMRLPSERERMEAYLSEATDIYDLEARMRAWDSKERQKSVMAGNYWYQ